MIRRLFSLAGLVGLSVAPAAAQIRDTPATVELRPGWREGDVHIAGLDLRLDRGWKTYWRVPGQAGLPPRFDWSGSSNLADVEVDWPAPRAFDQAGFTSFGYVEDVVLPLKVTPADPDRDVRLAGEMILGICRDVCIPARFAVTAVLPANGGRTDVAIARARRDAPAALPGPLDCTFAPEGDGLSLTVEMDAPRLGGSAAAVIEAGGATVRMAEASAHREGGRLSARATLTPPGDDPLAVDRSAVRVTLIGESRAAEITGCD